MAKSPVAILYDASGNPISVVTDGSVYRLSTTGKLQNASGTTIDPSTETTLALIKNTDGIKKITDALPTGDNTVGQVKLTDGTNVVDVLNDAGVKRLRVDAKVSTATTVNLATDYLRTAAAAYQMKVNGSGTPVVFYYSADATKDITVLELRIVFSAESLNWSGAGFGKAAAGALANGVLVELVINSGTTITLSNIMVNEDFLRTYGEIPAIAQSGANDVLVTAFKSSGGLTLKAGTADRVRMTVRDNLTNAALGVSSLTGTFFGEKAI